MGVNGTGQIYKGFTFDGIKSKDYGVYITGEGVYNAPVRDVEMITIPNRNGSFVLDHGRFENIEVTYPAGMFGATQTDFADGINALRNALASRKGYVRLEDEYNPNEYRMAVYKSGLEVSPVQYGQAGEFEIVFECKPQRFLKSGESAVSVNNNGTITNPTLFESRPTLQIWGYGQANLGDQSVKINSEPLGEVTITTRSTLSQNFSIEPTLSKLNTSDTISLSYGTNIMVTVPSGYEITEANRVEAQDQYITPDYETIVSSRSFSANYTITTATYVKGTSSTSSTSVARYIIKFQQMGGGNTRQATYTFASSVAYNGSSRFTQTMSVTAQGNADVTMNWSNNLLVMTGDSTQSALGQPVYFDLDIGEAYKKENGQIISINNAVEMPAELPTLKPGATTITYDNTITQFKIVPRWWIV